MQRFLRILTVALLPLGAPPLRAQEADSGAAPGASDTIPAPPSEDLLSYPEGILETDDISVSLVGDGVWIRITAMEDAILRYATLDTRKTYTVITKAHRELDDPKVAASYTKFLVMVQGRVQPQAYFEPTEFEVVQQGRRYKPLMILPHSSTWDQRVLKFYGVPETAIYLFPGDIDLQLPMQFVYKHKFETGTWDRVVEAWRDAKVKSQ